jgi:DNA-binding response OmpR family regulator
MKLLVVEDDPALQQALLRLLGQWGYAAEAAGTAATALGWLEKELFDLVLLDLGLPDRDGLSLCRQLRQRSGHQPLVLMLTARDDRRDKVLGFEEGADDPSIPICCGRGWGPCCAGLPCPCSVSSASVPCA